MEDRELLKLSAKAAGLHVDVRSTIPGWLWVRESKTHGPYRLWNPLTDDGDALRLAVKLGIFDTREFFDFRSLERFGGQDADDNTATRRAIVRAAAALATA